MNILYVGTLPPHQGGTAIMCTQLLERLASPGHRIRAVAPIAESPRSHDKFAGTHPALNVTRYLLPYLDVSPDTPPDEDYRKLELRQIRGCVSKLVDREQPDVVIAGRESFARYVQPLAASRSLPCVLFVQGATMMGILNGTYPEEATSTLLRRFRAFDRIITPARHVRDTLHRLSVDEVEVVPNPVDLSRFFPTPTDPLLRKRLGICDSDLVVAHVSNLKRLKRPLDILDSAKRALAQNPRLLYLIVGDGPLRQTMESVSREHGLSRRFRFTGWVEHDRIPEYLNLADVVVMPSEGEAQALVYLEAQACGRTLVASRVPGAAEVIDDGRTGLLFRTGDIDDLTEKTLLAAGDARLRERIGRYARRRVGPHSLDRTASRYREILAQLAAQPACS